MYQERISFATKNTESLAFYMNIVSCKKLGTFDTTCTAACAITICRYKHGKIGTGNNENTGTRNRFHVPFFDLSASLKGIGNKI